jgi:Zn finger protein HypA/HybF involved in hydrogenase expression
MKKLTLDFDALAVESFHLAAEVSVNQARITCRCTDCNCTYTCP